MSKPAATIGSMHVCPMCSGTVPHVGGAVVGPGAPNVLINGKPAAVIGDKCICIGPPDSIIQGNPSILINGVPIACMGNMTAHGGSIVIGEPNVLIGTNSPEPSTYMPLKSIPFPKITPLKITVASAVGAITGNKAEAIKKAQKNIDQSKNEAFKHGYLPDIDFSL